LAVGVIGIWGHARARTVDVAAVEAAISYELTVTDATNGPIGPYAMKLG
jgi:hypothetical protein